MIVKLISDYRIDTCLEWLGPGAYKRPGEKVNWKGGLSSLQYQLNINVHVGVVTSLSMQGHGYYLRLTSEVVFLFSQKNTVVPKWFLTYKWGDSVHQVKTSFLPQEIGLTTHEERGFLIKTATTERAILECLYLVPNKMDLTECFHIMEGLSNLRPKVVQLLLEQCTSVKVKRLFLYLAKKAGHQWLVFLDLKKVDLGTGDRSIVKGGGI